MTTKAAEPGTPIAPFLLLDYVARGRSYSEGVPAQVALITDGYSNDNPGFDDVITAGFLACEEAGWIEVEQQDTDRNQIVYNLTLAGAEAHAGTDLAWVRDTFGVSKGKLPSPGDRALWLWLLRFGGVVGSYDTSPSSSNSNLMHVRACGLDFDRSGSVTDTYWSAWGGTFAEDSREKGVGGEAVCRCGAVGGAERYGKRDGSERPRNGGRLEVVASLNSYVDLLRAMVL